MSTGKKYNTKLTRPWELLLLMIASVGVFILTNYCFQLFNAGLAGYLIALIPAALFFYFVLRKYLVRKTEIRLSKSEIMIADRCVKLEDIQSYKYHRMRGAGLKMKLKNGKNLRLSSNEYFCDSSEFVRFIYDFQKRIQDYPNIMWKKTFFQTKTGYYIALVLSGLTIFTLLYQMIFGTGVNLSRDILLLVGFSGMWSGIDRKEIFEKTK